MKVRRGSSFKRTARLKNISNGELVQFTARFHQDMNPDHLFIKLNKASYHPDGHYDAIGVADVETGKLSFVDKNKTVVHVPAEIQTDE